VTWPSLLHPVTHVPGSARADTWEGLWSLWFPVRRALDGASLLRADGWLHHPDGGTLWVADPLNALLAAPLTWTIGPAAAWSLLATAHVAFAGLAAHALGSAVASDRSWGGGGPPLRNASPDGGTDPRAARAGWVAGLVYATAPILIAHLHNGATEAVGTGWLAAAALACWRLRAPGRRTAPVVAGMLLGVCAVAHVYAGVAAAVLCAALLPGMAPDGRRRLLAAGAVGLLVAAGPLALAHHAAGAPDNLLGIKGAEELARIRRTLGAADVRAYVIPGGFRAPDFRVLAPFADQFVHTTYLGWVAIAAALLTARTPAARPWIVAGAAGLVLSLGPVLLRDGSPLAIGGRAVPLPWRAIEMLPGLRSLSLLWRLGQLPALALAVLAGLGASRWRAGPWLLAPLALAEVAFASPVRGMPAHVDATPTAVAQALAAAPPGAVLVYPPSTGRRALWDQVTHGHPLVGSVNFSGSARADAFWAALARDPAQVAAHARAAGIRYLVVRSDPWARPDPRDASVRALRHDLPPLAATPEARVYRLW
jgi:hypothetical protein